MKFIRKDIDWSVVPEIRWEKVLCPFCGSPTGPSSKCFDLDPEIDKSAGEDRSMVRTIEVGGEMLPIFSTQCAFRKSNDYYFYVNYPLSHPLVSEIGSVHGLEKLVVQSPYKGKITIADQFDEQAILQKTEEVYRTYINNIRNNDEKENLYS